MKHPLIHSNEKPAPGRHGHQGIVAERLFSLNGLISLIILTWSAAVLRRPALLWGVLQGLGRHLPWLVGKKPANLGGTD